MRTGRFLCRFLWRYCVAAIAGVLGVAATASASPLPAGYYLVGADGAIFPFGSVSGYGSTGGLKLTHPIVGMEGTPDGGGYWLVGSGGGIFPFGKGVGGGRTG